MIFPSGVPEFDELPPYCITRDTAEGVADQIAKVMAEGHFRGSYDISRHQPDRVAAETIEIISQAVRHNAQ